MPFGFAPFHLPGLAFLGIAILFNILQKKSPKQGFYAGFTFGVGFLGLGVSWVFVSIYQYGHLNYLASGLITLIFIIYLSLYIGLIAAIYCALKKKCSSIINCLLFSALWCLGEFLRSIVLGGFPWLILGFAQIDTPIKNLLPILGTYGASFFACLAAACLATSLVSKSNKHILYLTLFVSIILAPILLTSVQWSKVDPLVKQVGIIQANLSMRDKWDEQLFWSVLKRYQQGIEQLLAKDRIIVMPESAIPLPATYVSSFLSKLNKRAKKIGSAIILGIPQSTTPDETEYFNTMGTLGAATGSYYKQHLVPFGEFIPQPFQYFINWLSLPSSNMKAGTTNQPLIQVQNHPIASLICYELAYPQLLRQQLPSAEWIVSISDDGWFGQSFAMYQQLQIAQVLSMQTGRYQIVANNDGLSSIIDTKGNLVASLPAFQPGLLEAELHPATGASLWIYLGDTPILLICLFIVVWVYCKPERNIKKNKG
ncbi:MAG: apolipoprotein N-acyltransferase [Legionella sp.]